MYFHIFSPQFKINRVLTIFSPRILTLSSTFPLFYKKNKGWIPKMETNNISTIATFIAICLTTLLAYFGYTVDQAQATTVIMGVITLIIAIWSSKNPNTLAVFGNQPKVDSEEPVLNDEYECDEDGC